MQNRLQPWKTTKNRSGPVHTGPVQFFDQCNPIRTGCGCGCGPLRVKNRTGPDLETLFVPAKPMEIHTCKGTFQSTFLGTSTLPQVLLTELTCSSSSDVFQRFSCIWLFWQTFITKAWKSGLVQFFYLLRCNRDWNRSLSSQKPWKTRPNW